MTKKIRLHKEMSNKDIAYKIDWEGGMPAYILDYESIDLFNEPLREAVLEFREAAAKIYKILDDNGVKF